MLASAGRVVDAEDIEAAGRAIESGSIAADLIVLAQAYPGQFPQPAVDRLRRLAPLARVVGLLGSWCEGEMRTGKPWPAAIRIYWHQWPPRCDHELNRLLQGLCPAWGLPVTATDEERLLAEPPEMTATRRGLVAVAAHRFEMDDWLSAALRSRGYATVWLQPHRPVRVAGVTAAVFDGDDCRGRDLAALERLVRVLGRVPVIALLDFPRVQDVRRARAAGAAAVVSKPLLPEDLLWHLDRLLGEQVPV